MTATIYWGKPSAHGVKTLEIRQDDPGVPNLNCYLILVDGEVLASGGETGTVVATMPDEYDTGEYQLVSITLDSGRSVILHSARLAKAEP